MTATPNPDKAALVAAGVSVRKRLEADPAIYKIPVENTEIYALSEFLEVDECQQLMAMIDAYARPSDMYEEVFRDQYRTSFSSDLDDSDSFVRMVERRMTDLLGLDPAWGENFQGQRYEPGQQYRSHYDWFDTGSKYWNQETTRGGQRSWTAMVFLNDVEEGGETEFEKLGIRVPPQQGALLVWNNALPDGSPNEATLHAALPVIKGVKYVITKWFRTRPWH